MNVPPRMVDFPLMMDDGARRQVNGRSPVGAWDDQAATTYKADVYLSGDAIIGLAYRENAEASGNPQQVGVQSRGWRGHSGQSVRQ
ncbi:MAG: hypothetical protein U9R72_02795 [Chloroflexota bacterium]|nr:hypothetical protein [Chloroflexota bacterium]